MDDLAVNSRCTIPASALSWRAVRASGPGGQHVNKTSTRVELTFDPNLAAVPRGVLRRLRDRRPGLFDSDGRIRIESQQSRSQTTNLADCLKRLADLLRQVWHPPKPRKKTKPTRASIRRRLDGKKRRGDTKKMRGKYRGD